MMKPIIISTLFIFVFSYYSLAETCNCHQEFIAVKNKIETNYAGFKDKVNAKTEVSYHKHTQSALKRSKLIIKPAHCIYLINDWLTFFKDGHIQIGRNRISKEIEEEALKKRIAGMERLLLSSEQLDALKNKQDITGIYWDEDSTSQIAVVRSKTSFREYAGVVLSSKSGKWLAGQVVLELKDGKDTLKGILYNKYYIPTTVALQIKPDAIGPFRREGSKRSSMALLPEAGVFSQVLSDKTLYMKIRTFNQENAKNIDSLFSANQSNLSKMPNLILDLRDNGGGADFSYRPITSYLYTDTIRHIGADVLATDQNIAGWAAIATTNGIPPDQKVFIKGVIDKMEQQKGTLVSFSDDKNIALDSVFSYPQKVIILINENCGSTTEEFLLMARQSRKVTLMGEHTAGVLDYSNMRAADFNCMPYMLYWATSRSRRIDQQMAIDNIGIMPDKTLKSDQNWIQEAKEYVEM